MASLRAQRSNPSIAETGYELLRGACHRARICATRWPPCAAADIRIQLSNSERVCVRVPAARCARGLRRLPPPGSKRGRREDRVRAAPAVSCAKCTTKNAHEHTGSAEAIRPSLRDGLQLITCSSRRTAFLPPSPPRSLLLGNLTPAPRCQNHTPSPSARQRRSSYAAPASTASHRAFVTIASRPSHRVRRGELVRVICPACEAEYF